MSNTIYSDKIIVNCPLVHDENGYYHLIYRVTNKKNGKIYIGKHSTKDPYDNYMGSGIRIGMAIAKYGIENFTKEILFCFNKEEDAFLKEAEIVNFEFIKDGNTYNIVLGGHLNDGSWCGEKAPMYGRKHTKETGAKISKALKGKMVGEKNPMYGMTGEKNPFYGKKHTKETKEKLSKSAKERCGEKNHMYGKHLSQEAKDKISKANKGKLAGENNPMYGKTHSQEARDKISKARKGKRAGENHPRAKTVLKLDEFGNIITEYGCIKDCCEQEGFTSKILMRLIRKHVFHNGAYFICITKN